MVNKFGDYSWASEDVLANIQVVRKVKEISGTYKDYIDQIKTSIELGFTAYRIAAEESPTSVFVYDKQVWCLGSVGKVTELISDEVISETKYLVYWIEGDLDDDDGVIAIKGDKGMRGEKAIQVRGEKEVAKEKRAIRERQGPKECKEKEE